MKNTIVLMMMATAFTLFISCNTDKQKSEMKSEQKTEKTVKSKKKDCDNVHWSHHKGEHGPENWENLCEGFSACGGDAQSPIDITETQPNESLNPIEFNYGKTKTSIINNGHTVQFNVDEGSTIVIDGKGYDLLQFHYHATSEHTYNGDYFPLEVHFVHKHSDTDLAVVGIMYDKGEANELFSRFLQHFPKDKGEYNSDEVLALSKILPKNKSDDHYSGSLTTPPCSEVVSWFMLQKPLKASQEQIDKFSKILDKNFRPVQKTNGRKVYSFNE